MKDKVAVITGGTRGIGLGIARGFARRGAHVALVYRSDDEQAEEVRSELGSSAITIQADVTQPSDRERVLRETLSKWGKVDVLVNNAGIKAKHKFLKESESEYNAVITTNLTAPIFLSQLVARHMDEQKVEGSIINISSMSAHMASHPTSYCAAKAGLLSATKTMAYALASKGIRVNAISPGCFRTDMNAHVWRDTPDEMKIYENNIPMQRSASIDEIAGTAIYLATQASGYATGAEIKVDGGALLF